MCKELSSAKGIVYRIQCLISDKSYVGQTGKNWTFFDRYAIKRSIEDKPQSELFSYWKSIHSKLRIAKELKEEMIIYPSDQFKVTILAKEIKNDLERDALEIKFIKKYKCLEKGYNSVKNNWRGSGMPSRRYSIINLRTMEEIEGSGTTLLARGIIDEIKPSLSCKSGVLEKVRTTLTGIPRHKLIKRSQKVGWMWPSKLQHLSIFGYAASWWLKNGLPDYMEIVPHEYDTLSGKVSMPLLKVKDECFITRNSVRPGSTSRAAHLSEYIFSTDPEENENVKKAQKNELSEWIINKATIYAEKLAKKHKNILQSPLGPGAITSYLNNSLTYDKKDIETL